MSTFSTKLNVYDLYHTILYDVVLLRRQRYYRVTRLPQSVQDTSQLINSFPTVFNTTSKLFKLG